jgi:ribose 5-phosphate isomerase RpiB
MMRVGMAADRSAFELNAKLVAAAQDAGYEVTDIGTP